MLFTYTHTHTLFFIVWLGRSLRRLCDKLCGAFSLVFSFSSFLLVLSLRERCECLLKVCTTKPFAIVIGGVTVMVVVVAAAVVMCDPMVVFLIHLSIVSSLFIFYLLEMFILIRGIIREKRIVFRLHPSPKELSASKHTYTDRDDTRMHAERGREEDITHSNDM